MENRNRLPLVAMRGLVAFPGTNIGFDIVRGITVKAIEQAMDTEKLILIVTQKDVMCENPDILDLYKIGCIAKVKQYAKTSSRTARVMVEVKSRIRLCELTKHNPYLEGYYEELVEEVFDNEIVNQAYFKSIQASFEEYLIVSKNLAPEKVAAVFSNVDVARFSDAVAANIDCGYEQKQMLLEDLDVYDRMQHLLELLKTETQIAYERKKIDDEVRKRIDENQREYYLREEKKVIEKELADKDGFSGEIAEYRKRIKEAGFIKTTEEKLLRDTKRLSEMSSASADVSLMKNYLDTVLELPWGKLSEDNLDIETAAKILNDEHYGLDDVKERIIEHLAVHSLTGGTDGTVLCLAGPPGTGKTSVASSVAKALGREFIRISLGGVHDEAEIRGHRKTYIGAMPGRIISAMKQAGTSNPVILLDEIDKLGKDYKGDPSAALLEVLDFEQNHNFRDNYLEIPYDLSKVMFIATANNLSNIPSPLFDRVEIIEINGYTNPAKLEIAKQYLVPKQMKKNGLSGRKIAICDDAIEDIINFYTKEAGVRELERKISTLMRKIAKSVLAEGKKSAKISSKNLVKYLGKHKYSYNKKNDNNEIGTVRGLAWTSVGGDTLSVEVNVMSGNGKVELTGNLGDVMKESAMTAVSYVRSQSDKLNIKDDFYKTKDIHIHVPEGAVPKDGPSAGITIATAVASALTNIPVKSDVAMTGEITLRGKVLPIGGLREKSLAAYRAGITTVVIPDKNIVDIDDIPDVVKDKIKFIPVNDMGTVLKTALVDA